MRVLVVEDDQKIASFIVRGLKQASYSVDHASDGEAALAIAQSTDYDAAVVDIMLPKLDGISLVRRLRAERRVVPVLFLSARTSVDDRVRGLQSGGDDYMTKPFAFSELLARVQSLVRRSTHTDALTELRAAGIVMNLLTREVTRDGRKLDLQAREFALLEHFLRQPGRVLTKTLILEHV